MDFARLCRHALRALRPARRLLAIDQLGRIESQITLAERAHTGEIRVAIETALSFEQLWHDLTPRARALQVFAALGVWDTEANNGVLIYVLLADRSVEIVADRAIAACVPEATWSALCVVVQEPFRSGDVTGACCQAVQGVGSELERHFPSTGDLGNQLPNQPVLL